MIQNRAQWPRKKQSNYSHISFPLSMPSYSQSTTLSVTFDPTIRNSYFWEGKSPSHTLHHIVDLCINRHHPTSGLGEYRLGDKLHIFSRSVVQFEIKSSNHVRDGEVQFIPGQTKLCQFCLTAQQLHNNRSARITHLLPTHDLLPFEKETWYRFRYSLFSPCSHLSGSNLSQSGKRIGSRWIK